MANLVRGSKYQFDFRRKLPLFMLAPEFVEGVFLCDVPLDGGVGAGGSHGLDLVLGGFDESFLLGGDFACDWVYLLGVLFGSLDQSPLMSGS